jgi:probable poly-beta-1,6-N-acetyl-D-glucosamine export protein
MRGRLIELDFFKGIAILSVIFIHMSGMFLNQSDITTIAQNNIDDYFILNVLSRFSVPGFILITGLLLTSNTRKINYYQFFQNKLKYIIIPYIIWTIFYIYINSFLFNISVIDLKIALLYGYGSYHLYYVVIIVQFFLLYLVINKWLIYLKIRHLIILFFIQLNLNEYIIINQIKIGNFNFVTTFIPWTFIFLFGCYIGHNYSEIKELTIKYRIFILNGLFISIAYQFIRFLIKLKIDHIAPYKIADGTVIVLTIFIFLSLLSLSTEISSLKILSFFTKLGSYSFGIYLVHPIIISFIRSKFNITFGLPINMITIYIEVYIVIYLSYFFTKQGKKVRIGKFIFGK